MVLPTFLVNPCIAGPRQRLAAIFPSESHTLVPRKLKPERFQPKPLCINLISILRGNSARKLWIHHHDFSSYGWKTRPGGSRTHVSQKPLPPLGSPRVPTQKSVLRRGGSWWGPGWGPWPAGSQEQGSTCPLLPPTLHPGQLGQAPRRRVPHRLDKGRLRVSVALGVTSREAFGRTAPGATSQQPDAGAGRRGPLSCTPVSKQSPVQGAL